MSVDDAAPPITLFGNRELNIIFFEVNINNWTSVTTPIGSLHFLHLQELIHAIMIHTNKHNLHPVCFLEKKQT